jgi:hypothetical protein
MPGTDSATPDHSASPTVSVVVPVHNGAAHLAQTLRAIHVQTCPVAEVIVVDEASTDPSVAVAEASGVPLRVLHKAQQGVSSARNRGLQAATGEFICFVDQDDVWHPEHVQRQLAVLATDATLGAVVSPYRHWYPNEAADPAPEGLYGPRAQAALDPAFTGWVYHQFLLDCWALTSATMLRRQAVLDAGGFDETLPFSEDWDLWLRLSREVRFAQLNWPPVLYRQHASQGSRRTRPVDYRCRLLLQAARRHGLASRDGRAVERRVFNRTIAGYRAGFGYEHLRDGDRLLGVRALLQAWARRPAQLRLLALAGAGSLGWRPAARSTPRAEEEGR